MQKSMRVYHFTNKAYGIEDLEKRRLKIARIEELNDPFELLAPRFPHKSSRAIWQAYRTAIHNTLGVICFNCEWNNPVHWSHYADKHRGICLGFDVSTSSCFEVMYKDERLDVSLPDPMPTEPQEIWNLLFPLMTTKYSGWSYERERRMMVFIRQSTHDRGHYFQAFRDIMTLKEVTIGVKCDLRPEDVRNILGDMEVDIQVYQATLALNTYEIERHQ